MGAWVGTSDTLYAFAASAVTGGLIAIGMVLWKRSWHRHWLQFWTISNEIMQVRDPVALSAIARERKPTMLLLPYGIPLAIGSIAYFIWAGMLL